MKQIKPTIIAFAFLFCLYILFFQAEWLGMLIIKNPEFPLGTLISCFMIIDLSYLVYSIFPVKINSKSTRNMKISMKAFFILSIFWGLFSYLLSGNWKCSFQNINNFYVWVILTFVFVLFPLSVLVFLIFRIFLKKKVKQISFVKLKYRV